MTSRFHAVATVLWVCGAVLLTGSCSLPGNPGAQPDIPARHQPQMPVARITQRDFGRDATYGLCVEPACPAVTRKTLASTLPAEAPAAAVGRAAASTSLAQPSPAAGAGSGRVPLPATQRLLLGFSSGASRLDAGARRALDGMLPTARDAKRIVILGRTDNVGTSGANHVLARARAMHVRNYLVRRINGVAPRIAIDAKGACCFLSTNDTVDGRQANRRVEVVFTLQN